jgi:hypothetical protein
MKVSYTVVECGIPPPMNKSSLFLCLVSTLTAVCGHGIKALASTWASLLPFVFCAFVIMTVRIAWWQVPADFVASARDTEVEKKETEKVHAVVAEEQGASADLEAAEEEEETEDLDIATAVR